MARSVEMVAVAVALVLALPGCYLWHERATPDPVLDGGLRDAHARDAPAPRDAHTHDAPAPRDAPATVDAEPSCDGGVLPGPPPALDLLFVVDSSSSMLEEQVALAAAFPRMIDTLVTGDVRGDGTIDFTPVDSLRVGVVTTDLGGGAVRGAGCPVLGDDGVLRTGASPPADARCASSYPPFLTYFPGGPMTPTEFALSASCVARVGIGGCGIEQPFEAALKALTPSTSTIRFMGGTTGHGDGRNGGFRRSDAVLAILFLSDEDDCSIRDELLFDPASTRYEGLLRCTDYPDALHLVSRYVDGYRAIEGEPDDLVVAAIAGVPSDLLPDDTAPDFDAILADPRMELVPNPADPDHLTPACDVPGRGSAEPARRIVELVRSFGRNGGLVSICDARLDRALDGIIDRIGRAITRGECSGSE